MDIKLYVDIDVDFCIICCMFCDIKEWECMFELVVD